VKFVAIIVWFVLFLTCPVRAYFTERDSIILLNTPTGRIHLHVLKSPDSGSWACRPSIADDEGAISAYPSRTQLRALDVPVSTDHDVVFLDDSAVVVGVVANVPQTTDIGGPVRFETSAAPALEPYVASYAVILNAGRSAKAGITKSTTLLDRTQLLDLRKLGTFDPVVPCIILKR
jgi:hypothetical protein